MELVQLMALIHPMDLVKAARHQQQAGDRSMTPGVSALIQRLAQAVAALTVVKAALGGSTLEAVVAVAQAGQVSREKAVLFTVVAVVGLVERILQARFKSHKAEVAVGPTVLTLIS